MGGPGSGPQKGGGKGKVKTIRSHRKGAVHYLTTPSREGGGRKNVTVMKGRYKKFGSKVEKNAFSSFRDKKK